ncbi:MAG: flippase-like domain-containing protein [Candidatus Omnitrophica bacterium]|nr:flippase-like domain-containing protein [Candidatus Omnitrophota bacterium]MDE2222376.1 flippase-like domain-containing protein [Candidatus Omnitrophota bacterium]
MTEKSKHRSIFTTVLPFVLSLGLLTWLFMTIDYKHIWQAVKGADMRYLAAAGIIFFLINFLIVWRWRILMKALGLKPGNLSSIRWFFLSQFCGLAPISTVGSDVIRGLGLAQETGHKPKMFASIVLDRLSGFAGIVILAVGAYLMGHGIISNKLVIGAIAALSLISAAFAVVLFSRRIFAFACEAFHAWPKVRENLMRMHHDIILLRGKQVKGWEAISISIFAQIVLAVEFYLTAKGMHMNVPLVYFIIFSPIVCVVTSLPSIGGLGFREIGWVYLLPLVGVSKEMAGGLSLVNSAFNILNGLLCGLFYVTTLSSGRIQCSQAEAVLKQSSS